MSDRLEVRWIVYVQWDDEGDYVSPPIGPFRSEAKAMRFAKECRRRLRANGYAVNNRVFVRCMTHPERALGWMHLSVDPLEAQFGLDPVGERPWD